MIALVLATSVLLGPFRWSIPEGWESLPPPADQGIDYIFEPIARGGPVITVSHEGHDTSETLRDEAEALPENEVQDGRTLVAISSHATCGGMQQGYDVDMTFGELAAQRYHPTIGSTC